MCQKCFGAAKIHMAHYEYWISHDFVDHSQIGLWLYEYFKNILASVKFYSN
jgi:hypothetical protein